MSKTQTTTKDADTLARELVDRIEWVRENQTDAEFNIIDAIKSAIQSYGDECAKQMRHDCAHFAWELWCGGRDIKDVPIGIRALPLPSEKEKS